MTPLCTISSRECEWGQSIQIEFWYWSTGYLIRNNFSSPCCSSFVEIQQTLALDLTFDIKIPSHDDLYIIIYVWTHNISCSLNIFQSARSKTDLHFPHVIFCFWCVKTTLWLQIKFLSVAAFSIWYFSYFSLWWNSYWIFVLTMLDWNCTHKSLKQVLTIKIKIFSQCRRKVWKSEG